MKKNMPLVILGAVFCSCLLFSYQAFAVEVVLKNGQKIQAKAVQITDTLVNLDLEVVEMKYPLEDIQSINGIEDISETKLRELRRSAYQSIDEAAAGGSIDGGKCAEGIDILKKIEGLGLPGTEATQDMIIATKRCKRHDESIPYIEKMLQNQPGDVQAHMEMANVYRHHGQDKTMMGKAITEYEKVVAIQGPTAENQYEIGRTYWGYQEWAKAIPYFEEVVKLKPDSWDAYVYLGLCLNGLGKYEEAIIALQKAAEQGSQEGITYHGLSVAYEALGQKGKAVEAETKAKELGYYL